MVKKLDKVDVVIVGSGWTGGIIAAELTKAGHKVVILERGKDKKHEDFIGTKDELRYSQRYDLMQNLHKETITSRSELSETALPVRNNVNARLGENTGGAGVHWNGWSFRWLPYDFEIYSKTVERYGKEKIPSHSTIQDWGLPMMSWSRISISLKKQPEFRVKKTHLDRHAPISIRIHH